MIRGMAEQAVWGIWMRTDDSAADPMFQTGIQPLIEDKSAQALEKFDQVIAVKPEFAEAWNHRGDAYQFMGDEERALEINPNLWNVVGILQRLEKLLENDRI